MPNPTITISKLSGQGVINQDWFLREEKDHTKPYSRPVPATFRPLINGQEAFGTLYDYMQKADSSIDIAIWGFQPSMFFKREGDVQCIGDLLIQKAKSNIQIKILVWSMWFNLQTFKEANMGNQPELFLFQKKGEDSASVAQKEYDYWWYKAIKGEIGSQDEFYLSALANKFTNYQFNQLFAFSRSQTRLNLQFKKRNVEKTSHHYPAQSDLPYWNQFVLWATASHHQKTVLIDYDLPDKAVGFVLEHNMLDAYWDESTHFSSIKDTQTKRNAPTPLQDVSSLVTGQVLWDINHNFCQSWDRPDNINLPSLWDFTAQAAYEEKLTPKRKQTREDFIPQKACGKVLMAQILRTYDKPREENIRKMYLQNIRKATHFVYTENQYFRWTELVREYQSHWEKLKENNRDVQQPLYWFVVTNSSDYGIGDGTYSTNEMLKLLGRQDVMPGVATQLDQDKSNDKAYQKYDDFQAKTEKLEKQLEKLERKQLESVDEYNQLQQQLNELKQAEYNQLQQQLNELKQAEQQAIAAQYEEMKQLKRDVSDTVGIRCHICTLTSLDAWQEVYIHSKVTIIDDVFTFLGSANLNTRSMQVDTELGIISECKAVSQSLRQSLWGLHTNNDLIANPPQIDEFEKTTKLFKRWEQLMRNNFNAKVKNEKPKQPLCEFLRLTTEVKKAD